jgi:uncharacterized protein
VKEFVFIRVHPWFRKIARSSVWEVGLLALLLFGGCKKADTISPTTPAPNQLYLNQAQGKLPTLKLWLGAKEMMVEVARTPTQVATGMMFRRDIAENEGMIFVFARPHQAAFYMRNTTVPLSCAYIDTEGIILEIHNLVPLDETPVQANSDRVQYVLETKQGWFERNRVGIGAVIRTERGTLSETFFPGQ